MIKLEILTHSGEPEHIEAEAYEPIELNQLINDPSTLTVLIGKNIYSRVDIKAIKVIEGVADEPMSKNPIEEPIEEATEETPDIEDDEPLLGIDTPLFKVEVG